MFVDRLSSTQQEVLLSLANRLMTADGRIAGEEIVLLDSLKKQIPNAEEPREVPLSELSRLFPARAARVALLLELLGMALVDGEYHEHERSLIDEVAAALEMPMNLISDMESWVWRQFGMVREAEQFMEA